MEHNGKYQVGLTQLTTCVTSTFSEVYSMEGKPEDMRTAGRTLRSYALGLHNSCHLLASYLGSVLSESFALAVLGS